MTLAAAVYARAEADLAAGVCEDLGRNDGTRIREYCRPFGIRPPCNWCAVGTSTWILEGAADAGMLAPVAGSYGARALGAQFRAAGRWVGRHDVRPEYLIPGNVVVWVRGDLSDPNEWRGHVGVVAEGSGDVVIATIEPNSGPRGDRVARSPWEAGSRTIARRLDDPRLLGIGLCTTFEESLGSAEPEHVPTQYERDEAARLMRLGAELFEEGEPADPLADMKERLAST